MPKVGDTVIHIPSGLQSVVVQIEGGKFSLSHPLFTGPYRFTAEWKVLKDA